MLRIAICDDSQLWLQKIETLTRGYLKKINVKYRLDLYQSGEKLLKSITSPYDIALLDVDLHSTNGIEVASQLRATNPQIVLIFVSEYVEYAPFGYEVDAIRYLLKNHLEQAFDRVMSEAVKKVREKHLRYAIVTDAGNVMVLVSDVYSTVLFFVVFTSLRHRVGGHHAGSAIRCLINSSLIVLCGLFLYPQITAGWPVVGHSLVGMIACLVIGLAGPCNDPHIAMTPAELDRNRKRMMWELLVLAVAFSVLPLLPWGVWLSKTAAAAVTLAASMLIAGKIQNGGFTHEQE